MTLDRFWCSACHGFTDHVCAGHAMGQAEQDDYHRNTFGLPMPGRIVVEGIRDIGHHDYRDDPAAIARVQALLDAQAMCSLGVGCDQSSTCYAQAMGEPDQCGRTP